MSEDPTAARELAENLKGLEGATSDPFSDILDEVAGKINPEEDQEVEETPDPEPKAVEAKVEDEPEEPEEKVAAEEEEDGPFSDLSEKETSEKEDPAPKGLSKAGKEDWERLRQGKAELKTQLAENERKYVTEIESLKKQVAEVEELREKAKLIEEAERKMALVDVTQTREYEETIKGPLDRIVKTAKVIAKTEGADPSKVLKALEEPDEERRRELLDEVTEDMKAVNTNELFAMAREAQDLIAKENAIYAGALEAAKETAANAEARKTEETRKSRQQYESAVSYVIDELGKRVPFVPDSEGEKKEEVYAMIERKTKEVDFENETMDKKAERIAARLLLPRMSRQLRAAQEKIETLEGRVGSKRKAEPKVGSSAPAPVEKDDYEGDPVAAVIASLGGEQHKTITEIYAELE